VTILRQALGKTTVQAVIALGLTAVFCYGFVTGLVTSDQLNVQLALVLGFFFGKAATS
jgi:hypothetical protein